MRGNIISLRVSPIRFLSHANGKFKGQTSSILPNLAIRPTCFRLNDGTVSLVFPKIGCTNKQFSVKSIIEESQGYLASEEDDELCPVECVREFLTDEELFEVLEKAKKNNALVVVDFYRTSCGSCKYIEKGFAKLCKASGDDDSQVIFLKHNVLDEYDEQSETADRLRIKTVPLFHFYKNGTLLEAFATRDKERITEAIRKYTSSAPTPQDV